MSWPNFITPINSFLLFQIQLENNKSLKTHICVCVYIYIYRERERLRHSERIKLMESFCITFIKLQMPNFVNIISIFSLIKIHFFHVHWLLQQGNHMTCELKFPPSHYTQVAFWFFSISFYMTEKISTMLMIVCKINLCYIK